MTLDAVMKKLAALGSEQTRKTYLRHGAEEPFFGVKIGDMKPLIKELKGRQDLAMELYATGNSDAMYLAGLIARGDQMTEKELHQWAAGARWHLHAGCTVAWTAVEHPDAVALAMKWIDSTDPLVAIAGWSTMANAVAVIPDDQLPAKEIDKLLTRVTREIGKAPDRVRYAMNNFVICTGTYCAPLAEKAITAARKIGKVEVDMGKTDCRVPDAEDYILKSRRGQPAAPKKKTARC